jgi:hypothetical protein
MPKRDREDRINDAADDRYKFKTINTTGTPMKKTAFIVSVFMMRHVFFG